MTDALLLLALFLSVVAVGTVATAVHDAVAKAWSGASQPRDPRAHVPVRVPLRTGRAAPVSVTVRTATVPRSPARAAIVRVRA
jgi:hypothetical protein